MSFPESLLQAAPLPTQAAGALFVIRCEPDPFTGEKLNIGVFGVDAGGRRAARVVQQPGRLECLYGDGAHSILRMAKVAEEAARLGLPSPSPQVEFDGPKPFFHQTLDQAIERAFADLITVALPQREMVNVEKVTDEAAQRTVIDQVKLRIGLNFELLASTPLVRVETARGPWEVQIPLQPRNGVGTILSADYGASTLKNHLMENLLNLDCAARHTNKAYQGLFILRPAGAGKRAKEATDSVIDSVLQRARGELRLEAAESTNELVDHIVQWGRAASVAG